MNADSDNPVQQVHRRVLEQIRAEETEGPALVEAMFREALARQKEVEKRGNALLECVPREGWEQALQNPQRPADRPKGVHYTELPEAEPGSPCCNEWNAYRREVARLLREGQGGRHALIKGETIIGIYDTDEAARADGLRRYLREPFLVQPIRAEEPYLRVRGVNFPWPNLLSR